MDDDIDIEEHDVLDNPVIKSVFPDISVIKKEITRYFEEGNFFLFIVSFCMTGSVGFNKDIVQNFLFPPYSGFFCFIITIIIGKSPTPPIP